jgi:hypothetical protein
MQRRVRQMSLFAAVAVALFVILVGTAFAQSDPNLGTWKLNLAKSKYNPGPPPISETVVIEVWETDGIKETFTIAHADGTRATAEVSYHYDGKDYKVTNGDTIVHTIVHRRVDADTITYTIKKGGKVDGTGKVVVSTNRKMRTVTGTGTNAKGQKAHDVLVWDKQ